MSDLLLLASTLLLAYIYLGYPLLLWLLARLWPRPHQLDETLQPRVTLVISARNEAGVIADKLENALALDYPAERLEILVISDCSDDATDAIVASFVPRGVRLLRTSERRGKTLGLNQALETIDSELVVFSDANAMYQPTAIRRLVRHFAAPEVGYVVGSALYVGAQESAAGNSEGTYWSLELRLKQWESDFASVVGGDGAIYAIRRELWEPLLETDINDFVNPLQIVAKGYRGIFDPEAICCERPAGDFGREFGRKVRIANRSFSGLLRVPQVLNPFRVGRFALLVLSHKLLRWFSPLVVALHFLLTLASGHKGSLAWLGEAFALGYLLLGLFALLGACADRFAGQTPRLLYLPYYLVLMNLASFTGLLIRLQGRTISTWETVRGRGAPGNYALATVYPLLLTLCLGAAWRLLHEVGLNASFEQGLAWLLVGLLVYTYLGYPLLLALLAPLFRVRPQLREDEPLPSLTLLIVAYNEAAEIVAKLENSLALDYPRERLRILVASDGSSDGTVELVQGFANRGVELLAFPVNRGKVSALNDAMARIDSELVVLSDANVIYHPQALRRLARHFADPRVGVVSGRVVLSNEELSYGAAEDRYYGIEHFIQRKEGETGALIGADGAMYAIRRELFSPPPADTILDDFVISMNIARQGYWALHDAGALGSERNGQEIAGEFRRKARIIAGGIQCLLLGEGTPALKQGWLCFKFVSHKLLRWFSGLLTLGLGGLLFHLALRGQLSGALLLIASLLVGGLLLALLGQLLPALRRLPLVGMIHYLFMLKLATLVGCYLGITGRQKVTWRAS